MPGSIKHLVLEWTGTVTQAPEPPPISGYLIRHPLQLPKLFSRNAPREYSSKKQDTIMTHKEYEK